MKEQFHRLLQSEKEEKMISFLRSLTPEQRKVLAPVVVKSMKASVANTDNWPGEELVGVLAIAGFACCSRQEFERFPLHNRILEKDRLNAVLNWYCPAWFGEYLNGMARAEFIGFWISYHRVVQLQDKGYMQPSPELLASLLPGAIFQTKGTFGEVTIYYAPERLLEHPVILRDHIWMLFEYESNLHFAGRHIRLENKPAGSDVSCWIPAFHWLVAGGHLERRRLLVAALRATHRNFNKIASGWFTELLESFAPTNEELTDMQQDLMAVLSAPHSKQVNLVLKYLRKLQSAGVLRTDAFIDHLPVLLSSKVKKVVCSALDLVGRLPEASSRQAVLIFRSLLPVFLQADDAVQQKAARLVLTLQGQLEQEVLLELPDVSETMTTGARQLLQHLLADFNNETGVHESTARPPEEEPTPGRVPVASFDATDELVFLASQVVENNNPLLIDLLPAALLQHRTAVSGQLINQLEPAIQQALKLLRSHRNARQGELDWLLAIFLVDIAIELWRTGAGDRSGIERLLGNYTIQIEGKAYPWQELPEGEGQLLHWPTDGYALLYRPHKALLQAAWQKWRTGDELPIMSTPTHDPGSIGADVWVKRLSLYQGEGRWPADMDLQVSVSRCDLSDIAMAVEQARTVLTGEYLELCLYLFGAGPFSGSACSRPRAWAVAALRRGEPTGWHRVAEAAGCHFAWGAYDGGIDWHIEFRMMDTDDVDEQGNPVQKIMSRHLRLKLPGKPGVDSNVTGNKKDEVFLYDLLLREQSFGGLGTNDYSRLLLLSPYHQEVLLARVINSALTYPVSGDLYWSKMVGLAVAGLSGVAIRQGNMTYLLLATTMLYHDKSIAAMAAGSWAEKVGGQQVDSGLLGQMIGKLQAAEYAPMKRLADVVNAHMIRLSPHHNVALQHLLEQVLVAIPDKAVPNLRKLLEVYMEVLSLNKSRVVDACVEEQLVIWQREGNLKKIVVQITALTGANKS